MGRGGSSTTGPVVSLTSPRPSLPHADRPRAISSPGSSIRHRPSTPPSQSPSPTSSSTSPRPTTSTSEAPPVRPAGDATPSVLPAHPRISAAYYHTPSSRRSLATLSRRVATRILVSPALPRHLLPHPTSLPASTGPLNFLSVSPDSDVREAIGPYVIVQREGF